MVEKKLDLNEKNIIFVTIWFSFAAILFLLNR